MRLCPYCHNPLSDADVDQLRADNEKLWELVRDVMPIVCDGCHERLCEMPKEEHPFVTCSFADRMRELGIEEPSRWVTCKCGEDVELFDGFHEAVCPSCGARVTGN